MFSVKYENTFGSTYIYFGGYEPSMVDSTLIYLPLADDSFWGLDFTFVKLAGSTEVYDAYSMAILDTGTTLTYLSPTVYWSLALKFESRFDCYAYSDILFCNCTLSSINSFPNLYFKFGSVTVEI